ENQYRMLEGEDGELKRPLHPTRVSKYRHRGLRSLGWCSRNRRQLGRPGIEPSPAQNRADVSSQAS
ncbi:hypothetical protein HispidOSU_030181, partial [Sigmodon hispidus]